MSMCDPQMERQSFGSNPRSNSRSIMDFPQNATMKVSDYCGNLTRLTGPAGLHGRLGLLFPIAAVLPTYPGVTSRRAVHADPAEVLPRG